MPIHDWAHAAAGDCRDFHQCWIVALRNALHGGVPPPGDRPTAEPVTGRPIADVVTLLDREPSEGPDGRIAAAAAPPTARGHPGRVRRSAVRGARRPTSSRSESALRGRRRR
jgi:hypothetical protein